MAASVDKMVADRGTVGACPPQGAPNRAQSEKAENALACRIALQDTFATGVLFAIVAAICVLPFSLIAYIVASGAGKLFDVSFLTGKPEQFKEGGGIGPELFNSFYLLVLTLLISVPIALGGAIYLTEYAPKKRLTHFVKTAIETLSSLPSIVVGLFGSCSSCYKWAGASVFYRVLWRSRCSICPFWCALFNRRSRLSPTTSAKAV